MSFSPTNPITSSSFVESFDSLEHEKATNTNTIVKNLNFFICKNYSLKTIPNSAKLNP